MPWFPNVCRRVLNYDLSVPLTYVVFDLLRIDGTDVTDRPYRERRDLLVSLDLRGPSWTTADTFDDGDALFSAVCAHGLEGVVAKRLASRYRPGERGWGKVKNPSYWRRESEVEGIRRSRDRRRRATVT